MNNPDFSLLARTAALAAALALTACAVRAPVQEPMAMSVPHIAPLPIAVTPVAPPDDVAPLLAYHQSLRKMAQGELIKELSGLGLQQTTPKLTLQMSMILMLTRGSGDLARAQAQLDSVATSVEPAAQSLRPLAQLLSAHCAEARRLADQADRLTVQLRENQRKTDQLNDMLEGLKAIERNLPVRPAATPGNAGGSAAATAASAPPASPAAPQAGAR